MLVCCCEARVNVSGCLQVHVHSIASTCSFKLFDVKNHSSLRASVTFVPIIFRAGIVVPMRTVHNIIR